MGLLLVVLCLLSATALGWHDEFVYMQVHEPRDVSYVYPVLPAKDFGTDFYRVYHNTELVPSAPVLGCEPLQNDFVIKGHVAFVQRGTCSFAEKAFHAQEAGAVCRHHLRPRHGGGLD